MSHKDGKRWVGVINKVEGRGGTVAVNGKY